MAKQILDQMSTKQQEAWLAAINHERKTSLGELGVSVTPKTGPRGSFLRVEFFGHRRDFTAQTVKGLNPKKFNQDIFTWALDIVERECKKEWESGKPSSS